MAQSELSQLQEKRDKLQSDLNELDAQILEYKKSRQKELMAELQALGLDDNAQPKSEAGKKRGRPRGFTMSDEHKQKMKEGRQRARAGGTMPRSEAESSEQPA